MSYKIGEVSKILNMSVETIRYYEDKNIISPSRHQDSKYRFYETWDVFFLMDCIRYKGFNFSLKEISHIMHDETLGYYIKKIKQKKHEFEECINYYTLLCEKLDNYRSKLETVSLNQGNFWFQKTPKRYYFICTESHGDEYADIDSNNGIFTEWMNYMPLISIGYHISLHNFQIKNNHIHWSLFIDKRYAEICKIPINDQVMEIPDQLCLCTIVDAGEKGELSLEIFEPAIMYIEEKGFKICGDIMGELLLRVHNNEKFCRYFEMMIPIEKKDD